HRLGDVRLLGDYVEAPVHAVREVDICVAAFEVHRLIPRRAQPAPGMACRIVGAEVCLSLDEPGGEKLATALPPQHTTEKCARDGDGVLQIEIARELLQRCHPERSEGSSSQRCFAAL